MLKISLVIGTRPQIIKSAPIIREMEKHNDIDLQVVHTGQHYDYKMSKIFFDENNLPSPKANLDVGSGSHTYQTAQIMTRLEPILSAYDPDFVLVPGDTNSALAAAIVSIKLHYRIAHVEAGPRSYEMNIPEEVNRRIVDHISSLLFAVSSNCVDILKMEHVLGEVSLTGDTMYDAYLQHLPQSRRSNILDKLGLDDKEYDVLTLHRAENVDDEKALVDVITAISKSDLKTIFPVHPRTSKRMNELGTQLDNTNLVQIEPLGYHDMIKLVLHARIVLTDSGGLQKEAFWSNTPCITLRNRTPWTETTELGVNFLAGTHKTKINEVMKSVVKSYDRIVARFKRAGKPYGDGRASKRIMKVLRASVHNTYDF